MDDFKGMFSETPAAEGGFALIDQGEYEAELVDCKLDITKDPGRLTIVYQITQEPYVGRKLFGNYQMAGQGIGFLKKDLTTLGIDFSEVGSPEDIAQLIWDAMPMPVIIFVNQKEYQGKTYNNVYLNSVNDVPAALSKPSPTNQKEQDRRAKVNAKPATKPTAKPAQKPTGKRPPPKVQRDEPDFGDDNSEVPF